MQILPRVRRTKKPRGWTLDEIFAEWWEGGDAGIFLLVLALAVAACTLADFLASW